MIYESEIWKDVLGFEGYYEVSTLGRVRSVNRIVYNSIGVKLNYKGKILKISKVRKSKSGAITYPCVYLSKHCKKTSSQVHRLVATSFIPNPYKKAEVNHIDGIKTNARVNNLEWVTHSENMIHAVKLGLVIVPKDSTIGEKSPNSKLKTKDVLLIREMYKNGNDYKHIYCEISKRKDISITTIYDIIARRTWKHV